MDELLNIIRASLIAVKPPRFYESERGFQGAFLTELHLRIPAHQWEGAIIEQEYQKRMPDHGINIRPDIIIHVPFVGSRHSLRSEGNFVVFELKLDANLGEELVDYEHLSNMCEILGYPLGVFINVCSDKTHLRSYDGPHKEKLHAFAVCIRAGQVELHEEKAT